MVEPHMVRVLGRSAFHDTALTGSGDLSYLGGEWRRDVTFAGFDVPIQMDVSTDKLINGVAGIDPQRRAELIKVLDIDLSWRLHKVSDGQRRRVQICMGLLKPCFTFFFLRTRNSIPGHRGQRDYRKAYEEANNKLEKARKAVEGGTEKGMLQPTSQLPTSRESERRETASRKSDSRIIVEKPIEAPNLHL
ncbi:unnamed protein product [Malus baccata var. baccata]